MKKTITILTMFALLISSCSKNEPALPSCLSDKIIKQTTVAKDTVVIVKQGGNSGSYPEGGVPYYHPIIIRRLH